VFARTVRRTRNREISRDVLFGKFADTEVPLEDERHRTIREDDVLGIME